MGRALSCDISTPQCHVQIQSVHLPHINVPHAKLEFTQAIDNCLDLARMRAPQQHIIIAIDSNCVVGPVVHTDDLEIVANTEWAFAATEALNLYVWL